MRVVRFACVVLAVSMMSIPAYAEKLRCGTRLPGAEELADIESGIAAKRGAVAGRVTIPVWVHVIQRADGAGALSNKTIKAQMDVLNDAYLGFTGGANSEFAFTLAGTTRTTNSAWFDNVWSDFATEVAMKAALKRGGAGTLNIYTVNGGDFLGWAYLPKTATRKKYEVLDGVVLDWGTLPGGPYVGTLNYSLGDTATHEVGHWLSLLHTFERGCMVKGDEVDDTPAEAGPNFFCNAGTDTCTGPKFPGLDPITNFMDYTDDPCMFEFTRGQAERMRAAWAAFRQ